MERKKEKPLQLIWDRGVPVWRATRAAIRAGYPVKRANLSYFADDEAALFARCQRLTAEQNEWLSPQRPDPLFDGTIRSVINLWQADPAQVDTGGRALEVGGGDVLTRLDAGDV